MKSSKYDDNGFITLTMVTFATMSVIMFTLWYVGAFDSVKTFLDDVFELLLDGTALGEWLGGIIIGIIIGVLRGLWDFGTDVGLSATDMIP